MKLLIISDIHLKPNIFDKADKIMEREKDIDGAVQLGDLVDNWGEEFNLALYSRTMERAVKFHKKHPNTLWCMGNHDLGYWHPELGIRETGHSGFVEGEMRVWLREMERVGAVQKIIHIVDNCIFSHAGLTDDWLDGRIPDNADWDDDEFIINLVNDVRPEELWEEYSPVWARPQKDTYEMWGDKLHVVGHTPVGSPVEVDNVLSTDTFSTYSNGGPIGDKRFAIVDTVTKEWDVVD